MVPVRVVTRRSRRLALPTFLGLLASTCVPDAGPRSGGSGADEYRMLVDAEDARPTEGRALEVLLDATRSDDPGRRRRGVRALGRLEDPELASVIAALLTDPDGRVRDAATEALAQSVHGREGGPVLDALLDRVGQEPDAVVRGTLARSLGRLRLDRVERRRAVDALVALGEGAEAPEATLVGVALGFESLVRLSGGAGLGLPAAELLQGLMTNGREAGAAPEGDGPGRIRSLAAAALGQSRRLSVPLFRLALEDPEPEVRRVVLDYLGAVPPSERDRLLRLALADTSARVLTAAVQHLAVSARTAASCDHLLDAADRGNDPGVRVTALAALARPCPTPGAQREALVEAVSEIEDADAPWQPAARALLSLTTIDAVAASRAIEPFVSHDDPFVRTWAARSAAAVRDVPALFSLSLDPSPNVRAEAVRGLFAVEGHGLDAFLVEQLEEDDPWLLMTVAELLEGAPDREAVVPPLVAAFERISLARRETWRDVRVALLQPIAELGDASFAQRLEPYLTDYDEVVADSVASVLEAWTGRRPGTAPAPLSRAPVPTLAELRALEGAHLTLHMRGGGALVLELLADQATTNVARLVRLAEAGYYDGLTFHRWVPNFVIQGGSPGANEYQGDGPYTRDEVGGVPHWRGTLGLSTRGRDTGDGQLFINLVHNPRLNHDYTVMGRLVAGYDMLDRVLEGTVIERAEVEFSPAAR